MIFFCSVGICRFGQQCGSILSPSTCHAGLCAHIRALIRCDLLTMSCTHLPSVSCTHFEGSLLELGINFAVEREVKTEFLIEDILD